MAVSLEAGVKMVIVPELGLAKVRDEVALSFINAEPLVLTESVGALVKIIVLSLEPMLPEPDDKVRVPVLEVIIVSPAAWDMVPPPVALSVTEEPCTFTFVPSDMDPPLLACKVTRPVAVIVLPSVMSPGAPLSVRLKEAAVEGSGVVTETALPSVNDILPVDVITKLGELIASAPPLPPTSPEPDEIVMVLLVLPVAVTDSPVGTCEMVAPAVLSVTEEP